MLMWKKKISGLVLVCSMLCAMKRSMCQDKLHKWETETENLNIIRAVNSLII